MSKSSEELKNAESALQSVIVSLIDSQEGFQKIGEELHDATLKHYFLAESLKRAEFRGDLETILHQEGVHDVKENGSASGTVHRVWGELKFKLGGGDSSLLATAEKGEDATETAYKKAIETYLPFPVRQVLVSQAAHILLSHNYVKAAQAGSV